MMNPELLVNCRLCNYQSDKRLMLNVFEEPSAYAEKIDLYLSLKVKLIWFLFIFNCLL